MLIPITILVRESASDEPTESTIAVNPHLVARVEPSEEDGVVNWWADGMDGPRKSRMSVSEFAAIINTFIEDEGEWTQGDSDTE